MNLAIFSPCEVWVRSARCAALVTLVDVGPESSVGPATSRAMSLQVREKLKLQAVATVTTRGVHRDAGQRLPRRYTPLENLDMWVPPLQFVLAMVDSFDSACSTLDLLQLAEFTLILSR